MQFAQLYALQEAMTSTSTSQANHITQRRSPAGETTRCDVGTSAGSHSYRRGADMASDAQPCNGSLDCSDGENNTNGWHACALSLWNHSALGPAKYMLPDWYAFPTLQELPTEVLLHILGFLEVSDLLSTSRTSHLFRTLSLTPILHYYRLRRTRLILPPLLASDARPSLDNLITRSIFLTHTQVVSRKLARSLVSIRLSRRLASRPSPEALVQRTILPAECVPGMSNVHVVPGLVAKKRAIEKERVKDGLRRWIAAKWKGEVLEREEYAKRHDESRGVGRVWRLTRFWERVSRGEALALR